MIAIHYNPNIENQVNYGQALYEGFRAHGLKTTLTDNVTAPGDIHCLIGPWYAYSHYIKYKNVLYLDRACWDHPNYTTVNWMHYGEKVWNWDLPQKPRYHPTIKPWKNGKRLIVLCDYGEKSYKYQNRVRPHFGNVAVREHPSSVSYKQIDLLDELEDFEIAIGGRTTALVTAAIEGLSIFCVDRLSPVYPVASAVPYIIKPDRDRWLKDLSWHNWTLEEIKSGQMWHHFSNIDNAYQEELCQQL